MLRGEGIRIHPHLFWRTVLAYVLPPLLPPAIFNGILSGVCIMPPSSLLLIYYMPTTTPSHLLRQLMTLLACIHLRECECHQHPSAPPNSKPVSCSRGGPFDECVASFRTLQRNRTHNKGLFSTTTHYTLLTTRNLIILSVSVSSPLFALCFIMSPLERTTQRDQLATSCVF